MSKIPRNPILPFGLKVEVYKNLHKDAFSVRDAKTKKVIAHVDEIDFINVTFKVSEAGRQRVLKERRKNVHAFVCGSVFRGENLSVDPVRYNPYESGTFTNQSGMPITGAYKAKLIDGRILIGSSWFN
jgi:hypothetical protein